VKRTVLPTAAFNAFHVLPSRHTARGHWPAASLAVPACQPAWLQCPPACAEPCGSPGACIGGASCALPIPAARLSCLVLVWSRDESTTLAGLGVGAEPGRPAAGTVGRLAANVPAGLAATLTLSRTDVSGRSFADGLQRRCWSIRCQPASLPARLWTTQASPQTRRV
jgi:hypothetical protein